VDAFTGITAYDITISGSLTLTGSVSSLNGFTGNLVGTSSWATNAIVSNTVRPSNTVSNFGYTVPYLSGTGSTATLFYSTTGPKYNPTTETVTSTNFEGTASRATEAVTATNLNGTAYPSGSAVGAASVFKFIAGAGQTDASSTATITVNELAIGGMRVLNQTCFITATAESATGTSIITVDPAGVPPNLQFKSSAPNTKFHFQIMYI
jgi:hypothetical protein